MYSFNLSKRKNAAAITTIDINTGEINRKILFTRREISSIVIPKLFKINILDQEVLIYGMQGNKEKFGILNFKGE